MKNKCRDCKHYRHNKYLSEQTVRNKDGFKIVEIEAGNCWRKENIFAVQGNHYCQYFRK